MKAPATTARPGIRPTLLALTCSLLAAAVRTDTAVAASPARARASVPASTPVPTANAAPMAHPAPLASPGTVAGPLPAAPGASATALAAQPARGPCLAKSDNGYLRARLRGALDLDLAWEGAQLQCDGGARPDGRGLRVTLAGNSRGDGRRLRFVFGIDDVPEGASVRARPTNLTLIFEGEQRLFATRGADKCTTDELRQERIGALGGPRRSWRVVARGFCVAPATTLAGDARLLLTSFDFASEVTYEDDPGPTH